MSVTKKRFRMEIIALVCSIVVVVVSATELGASISLANLIGLIAGSFGAGAATASAVRGYRERRMSGKVKETQ